MLYKLRDAQFAPRRLQFVQQTADAAPWLFLCEAVPLTGKAPDSRLPLRVLPPVLTSPAAPTHTQVYKKLYT